MLKTYKGKIVLKNGILNGYISCEDNIITYVNESKPDNCGEVFETKGYIMPGFIDIHCHANNKIFAYENPREVAEYHQKHGTTGMLLTFYRDVPHDKLVSCLKDVKDLIKQNTNVLGAHLEGPYLNANFGSGSGVAQTYPDKKIYDEYISLGVIKQWTCSPEVDGTDKFIFDISKNGIVPSIGHSKASFKDVKRAYDNGAKIVTHIFDATGTTKDANTVAGTEDMSFDESTMLMDDMFYEVIIDKERVHVKEEKLQLLIKTVGIDRVVCITDCFCGGIDDGRDINMVNGELAGSKLTMDKVVLNLFEVGYTLSEISKLTATNACSALNIKDRGEIAVGKHADLVLVNDKAEFVEILK